METWHCFDIADFSQEKVLFSLTRKGAGGEVLFAGLTYPARFQIAGLNRRWDFGYDESDGSICANTGGPEGARKADGVARPLNESEHHLVKLSTARGEVPFSARWASRAHIRSLWSGPDPSQAPHGASSFPDTETERILHGTGSICPARLFVVRFAQLPWCPSR